MLQSAIPVLVCITKCYSSDATQVPLATTKYCSSTTKYHRVLLQNNFVQQKKSYSSEETKRHGSIEAQNFSLHKHNDLLLLPILNPSLPEGLVIYPPWCLRTPN